MVAPLVVAAAVAGGAQVVSGIMQYYQAEKARKASARRLKEIEAMFDAIVPPDFDVKVWDNPQLVATIPEPAFNLEAITPEQYERVGQYVPQAAEVIAEKRPELVQASEAAKAGRGAQMDALERYKQIARSDFDPALQQQLAAASRKARTDAQSRQASILQDANRRGQGGSLATMATQLSGASDAMQRQAVESQMAAAESYRNRLAALDRSAEIGGQVRQGEMSEAARNADIINDFNQRTSARYQQAAQMRADLANQGQLYNLGQDQRAADANVGERNKATYEGVDRRNSMSQQKYQNQRATREDRLEIERYKNKLKQDQYNNSMSNAAAKAGVQYNGMEHDWKSAEARNAAVGSVADGISAGAGMYGKYASASPQPQTPPRPPQGQAGYDQGSTPGNYRRLDDEYWRTA